MTALNMLDDFKRSRFINVQADAAIDLANAIEIELGVADGARGEGMIKTVDGDVIGDPLVFCRAPNKLIITLV